ncbi:MAG: histidine phosphatase family protein [Gammaproteobacteria bacterium]|nr:histidine phosphatase family protein [Gammaproteobacteria bacterium]
MRRLTLLRHAKSSWRDTSLSDRERPLSSRGERDAPAMGLRLKAHRARPSLILTSHAVRARTTARIVARMLGYPEEFLQVERALYLAAPDEILAVVAAQDERFEDVLVVGHNPGLTELANRLLPELALDNLPTGGVVAIDVDAGSWRDVASAGKQLAYYDYPKNPQPVFIEHPPR